MALPFPVSKWGQIVCTEFGHIISNRQGWIWSKPGGYEPVFIPAQMVPTNPARLGNRIYFTKIEMTKLAGDEFKTAYATFHAGFGPDQTLPDGYRLDVTSVSDKTLVLDFFDYGDYGWGIWCPKDGCDPQSRFMMLDMSKRPN